jgi:hypothetical protein
MCAKKQEAADASATTAAKKYSLQSSVFNSKKSQFNTNKSIDYIAI